MRAENDYVQYLIGDEEKSNPNFNKKYLKMRKWLKRI